LSQRIYHLMLAKSPSADEARDVLELVLAAASLDLQVQVLLQAPALALVWPRMAPAWQQLIDHGLADILLRPPPDWRGAAPPGVRVLSAECVSELPDCAVELAL